MLLHAHQLHPASRWRARTSKPLTRTTQQNARHGLRRTSSTGPASPGVVTQADTTAASGATLVREILDTIDSTDYGLELSNEKRAAIDARIDQLEEVGASAVVKPLKNPLIFGNYNVAYVSTRRAPSRRGQPAGGRFRGVIGRTLFPTQGLFQSILAPDIATNKVAFKLLGLIPGYVGLRGKFMPVDDSEDTVKVNFERPVLVFGKTAFRIGPPSSVVLSTTYLDEDVRLGKGSFGSLFVFTRGGKADEAGMDQVGLEAAFSVQTLAARLAYASVMLACCWFAANGGMVQRAVAAGVGVLATLASLVLKNGGNVDA